MKKIKYLFLICFSLVLLMSLSSCSELDRLKGKRVELVDEDVYYLEYKGTKYRCLEYMGNNKLDCSTEFSVYIVEEDVPLLLMDSFGGRGSYDRELDVIKLNDQYYCSLSNYDRYESLLHKPLNRFKFSYYVYDYEKNEGVNKKVVLDEALSQEVNKYLLICDEVKHNAADENWRTVALKKCDETGMVENDNELICLFRNTLNGDLGIYRFDSETETYFVSIIPDEQEELFIWIFDELKDAIGY